MSYFVQDCPEAKTGYVSMPTVMQYLHLTFTFNSSERARTNSARSSWVRALSSARHHLQQPASRHDVLAGRAAGRTAPHPRQRHLHDRASLADWLCSCISQALV